MGNYLQHVRDYSPSAGRARKRLVEKIRAGSFREDLYYRLNVVALHIPPLRERREDIPPLVEHFVRLLAEEREFHIPPIVMEELCARSWPGNIRELKNACERMVILCRGNEASLEDLPVPPARTSVPAGGPATASSLDELPPLPPGGLSLIDLETKMIERVLKLKGGNITRAAAYLRIPRHVLVYRTEKYGIRRNF